MRCRFWKKCEMFDTGSCVCMDYAGQDTPDEYAECYNELAELEVEA